MTTENSHQTNTNNDHDLAHVYPHENMRWNEINKRCTFNRVRSSDNFHVGCALKDIPFLNEC